MPIFILIVDDEPDFELLIRKRFRKKVEDGVYRLSFARNGKIALDFLNMHPEIDIILTDINMPEMDGFTFLDKVNQKYSTMKSIVVTANGDLENIRMAMNRGAFDFITKPIDFEDLEITINKTYREVKDLKEGLKAKEDVIEAIRDKVKAEQSEKVKRQFLANVSHEIRTPMNSIVGMTTLLKKLSPRPDQVKYIEGISTSAENLLVIINDILDLSQIEAGKLKMNTHPFDVWNTFEETIELFKYKAGEKKLELRSFRSDSVPRIVSTDCVRLTQILSNLINNAIKYTDEGSVSVSLDADIIEDNKVKLYFQVKDSGIGISEDEQDIIFESFTQLSSDKSGMIVGTGLGLAICRELITLLDGRITVESSPGKGSTFRFDITAETGCSEMVEVKQNKHDKLKNLDSLSILLVEDNEFNVIVAKDFLESELSGLCIDVASNGEEALKMIQNSNYHIILMDLQMPVMDGYEAVRRIRELEGEMSKVPIIAMTASAEVQERIKCLNSGMNECIPKPFDVDELLSKISNLIKS